MATHTLDVVVTDEQKRQYWEQGFIVVKNVLTHEQVERYKKRATQIAHGDIPPGGEKMIVKDVRVAKGLYKPDDPEKRSEERRVGKECRL